MWTTVHGLADLWIHGGGLPGADATFGLDEFIALSQSDRARQAPRGSRTERTTP